MYKHFKSIQNVWVKPPSNSPKTIQQPLKLKDIQHPTTSPSLQTFNEAATYRF